MAQRTLPGLGLVAYFPKGSDNWDDDMNQNMRLLSAVVQAVYQSKDTPLPITCGRPGALPQPACGLYSPAGVDPVLFTPTSQQWSLTIERGLGRDLMLSVGYVGSQSYHTPLTLDTNTAYPIVCQDPQGCISGGTTVGGTPVPVSQRAVVPQGTLYMAPGTRPNTYVATGVGYFNQGTASYHSLNFWWAFSAERASCL